MEVISDSDLEEIEIWSIIIMEHHNRGKLKQNTLSTSSYAISLLSRGSTEENKFVQ